MKRHTSTKEDAIKQLTISKLESPIYGSDGTLVATGFSIGEGSKYIGTILRESDAKRIVEATNNYQVVLDALKLAKDYLVDYIPAPALYEIEDAIAKAEGKS